MPLINEITKAEFIQLYSENAIEDPINITVGAEQRIYGRTRVGQGTNPDGYIVVYAVI